MSNHTPTPWKQGWCLLDVTAGSDSKIIGSMLCQSQHPATEAIAHANAEYIVRCVNAHERIVAALRDITNYPRPALSSNDTEADNWITRYENYSKAFSTALALLAELDKPA